MAAVTLSASAIAFLAGYGVEAVFRTLDTLLAHIFRLGENQRAPLSIRSMLRAVIPKWRGSMGWNRWYVTKSYLRSSLWIVPLVALVLELLAIRGVFAIDAYFQWVPHLATTVAGTTGVMETVITLTISFIVFTFGSILIAIQVASGQLTPRIIATTLLRDNTIRVTVGLFVFTLLFAAGTNARIDNEIPYFVVTVAAMSGNCVGHGVLVPDRLHRPPAAANYHRIADRRAGHPCN